MLQFESAHIWVSDRETDVWIGHRGTKNKKSETEEEEEDEEVGEDEEGLRETEEDGDWGGMGDRVRR